MCFLSVMHQKSKVSLYTFIPNVNYFVIVPLKNCPFICKGADIGHRVTFCIFLIHSIHPDELHQLGS